MNEIALSENRSLVGIGQVVVSSDPSAVLVAPNLGSCLGIAVYDKKHRRGAMIHCMLPLSRTNKEKAEKNPSVFVDTGFTSLLRQLFESGSRKKDLLTAVAGGSNISDKTNHFEIGKKNFTVLRKLLWQNEMLLSGEQVGGSMPRSIGLEVMTGRVWVKSGGTSVILVEGNANSA